MAKAGRKPIAEENKKIKTFDEKYAIKYYIEEVPIRELNIVSIYIPENIMVRIAKAKKKHKISTAKILACSSTPCSHCKNEPVIIYHNGEYLSIPRGLLSKAKSLTGKPGPKKKLQ